MPVEPITPESQKSEEYLLRMIDGCTDFLNENISLRRFHDNFADEHKPERKDYKAVSMWKCEKWNGEALDIVLERFKQKGWDCKQGSYYDAYGTVYCAYFHKKHFE